MDKRPPKKDWHRLSNVRAGERLGDCSICGPSVPVRSSVDKRKPNPFWRCMSNRRGTHGLNFVERQEFAARRGERCEICGTTDPGKRGWMVDHCHETGAVRGLLCSPCNVGIGMLGDDLSRIYAAAEYLERFTPKFVSPRNRKTATVSFADYRPHTN